MGQNHFGDINSVKEFTKNTINQVLDYKHDKIPIYPFFFKDFPNWKQLDFGQMLGGALTFVMITAKESNADPNMLSQGIREAMEDIHDDLKSRYLKLG